ncbi:clock-controlled pheromone ccg-4 [Colletotrichum musicola]|uniref:Clock-controlled pheromone ccg-4 n=1 Tax=Colletotrichum musicola TaxID=2175873 RepID=A0A8H6K3L0_9PEZI|nr:clock-controlled pheromone ccg-4 [Colletotrichum musicola]
MQFLATILIAAVTVHGVAVPDASPEPWCRQIGQPCWKVKRAAEAFAASIGEFEGLVDRSPEALRSHSEGGGAAFMAKRGVDEIANVVAASQGDPADYYGKLAMERRFAEDTTDVVRREEEANPCRPGQACRKSEYPAEADYEEDEDDEDAAEIERREEDDGSCQPGQECWKSEYPFEDDEDDEAEKRDVHGEDKRWCRQIGQPCWRVKRAAEALVEAIGEDEDLSKREFNPVSKREPWCRQPGQPCWKRDADPEPWCRQIGQPCWKAARDLHAMKNVARSVIESLE